MRPSKSRSRAKNNRRPAGNNINRVFDSSGPEGKVRGTPQQIIEKYLSLARDATLSNDRVAAENFHQHAEHYTRMLAEAQREIDARREQYEGQQPRRERGSDDEGDESPAARDEPRRGPGGQQRAERDTDASANRPERGSAVHGRSSDDSDVFDGGGDPGLVETPEAAPKPRRASPRRRSGGSGSGSGGGAGSAGPDTGSGDTRGSSDGSGRASADAAE